MLVAPGQVTDQRGLLSAKSLDFHRREAKRMRTGLGDSNQNTINV